MSTTVKVSFSIPETLFNRIQVLAQQHNITQDDLVATAVERFIDAHLKAERPIERRRTIINQGDVHWVQLDDPNDLEAGIPHPHVVIQHDALNQSRIPTVVVCRLTSNLSRAKAPGNVLLEVAEANLPKQSVVEVSKVSTVDKTRLGDYIGSLSEQRINDIFAGMQFLQRSFFAR